MARTVARPIPRVPPVTKQTLPCNSFITFSVLHFVLVVIVAPESDAMSQTRARCLDVYAKKGYVCPRKRPTRHLPIADQYLAATFQAAGCQPASAQSEPLTAALLIIKQIASAIS